LTAFVINVNDLPESVMYGQKHVGWASETNKRLFMVTHAICGIKYCIVVEYFNRY